MSRSLVTGAALALALLGGCALRPVRSSSQPRIAWVGGTILPAPDAPAIPDGVLITDGDQIVAVGARGEVRIADDDRTVDCAGATLVAGFWNSHVRLGGAAFQGAATAPAARLEAGFSDLLLRWGFVHVVDLGSDLANTQALRARVRGGELVGPTIATGGTPFIAVGAQPSSVAEPLPELTDPASARQSAGGVLGRGADLVTLMTASVVASPPSPVMPVDVVRAVATEAHSHGALVVAHPTNRAGVDAAREGGADILAHTAPAGGPWSDTDVRALVTARMSLIPTLSLWRAENAATDPEEAESFERIAMDQASGFARGGGELLFGTDVGRRPESDPTPEHLLLERAGIPFATRLAMLTTAPARRFESARLGRLAAGWAADLVVLDGDPRADPGAWARVRCTVKGGQVVWAAPRASCAAVSAPR